MALDGIAAVQARIQAIEQQVASISSPSTDAASSTSGTSNGTDFASVLSSAMTTQAVTGQAAGTTAAGAPGMASTLTGTGGAAGTGTDITSLISSLTGGSASPDGSDVSALLAKVTGSAAPAAVGTGTTTNPTTLQFLDTALGQQGKPYVWASSAAATDANPVSFDCSELTKWAAARSGVTIPDGAAHQYVWLKQQGATMTVQQALQTPGALLFSFAGEPQPGLAGEPAHAHVAISLGNGMTIEARGHAYGVGTFAAGDRFNYAGMIPGMT